MGTPVLLTPLSAIVTGAGQCVVNALSTSWGGLPVGFRACLMLPTNQIPWDNCSCAGQFAQAILTRGGSTKFPQFDTGSNWTHCGPQLDVAIVMTSLSRCTPTMDDQGQPPSCAAELASALQLEADRETIRAALSCCLDAFKNPNRPGGPLLTGWNLGPSVTVGEQGGCVAIETPYTVGIGSRPCSC